MPTIELSAHAKAMLWERNLPEEWVWRTINSPDDQWTGDEGNVHYAKSIEERGHRVLHVIVNADVEPKRVVTVFFDRRLGKQK